MSGPESGLPGGEQKGQRLSMGIFSKKLLSLLSLRRDYFV
jgi:hypothetical protein